MSKKDLYWLLKLALTHAFSTHLWKEPFLAGTWEEHGLWLGVCVGTGSAALSWASSGMVQGQDKWLQPCLPSAPSLRPSRWACAPWAGNAQGIIFPLHPNLCHGGRKEWRQAIRALWAQALQPEECRAYLSLQATEYELRFFTGFPPHTEIPAVNPLVFCFRLLPHFGNGSAKILDDLHAFPILKLLIDG